MYAAGRGSSQRQRCCVLHHAAAGGGASIHACNGPPQASAPRAAAAAPGRASGGPHGSLAPVSPKPGCLLVAVLKKKRYPTQYKSNPHQSAVLICAAKANTQCKNVNTSGQQENQERCARRRGGRGAGARNGLQHAPRVPPHCPKLLPSSCASLTKKDPSVTQTCSSILPPNEALLARWPLAKSRSIHRMFLPCLPDRGKVEPSQAVTTEQIHQRDCPKL